MFVVERQQGSKVARKKRSGIRGTVLVAVMLEWLVLAGGPGFMQSGRCKCIKSDGTTHQIDRILMVQWLGKERPFYTPEME